jgi:hypothetical protein
VGLWNSRLKRLCHGLARLLERAELEALLFGCLRGEVLWITLPPRGVQTRSGPCHCVHTSQMHMQSGWMPFLSPRRLSLASAPAHSC